jgi:hypothetical protein
MYNYGLETSPKNIHFENRGHGSTALMCVFRLADGTDPASCSMTRFDIFGVEI